MTDFVAGLSARGTRLLTAEEAENLATFSERRLVRVHTIETYELRGEYEVPRVEFGLYGPIELVANSDWSDKVAASWKQMRDMLSDVARNVEEFRFQIWLEENPDGIR